ncbi:hypothetical protein TSUD_137190 [Trifolium subterraneum]|uniref:Late embryogenesis abundant protein LEA-2 subgroup domain-containing protein n=1 Tax=Trifolium subterraneum TaxID=3900 RepID=A0A2Z6PBI9_TRISU|nr:hypothetical protein TSUD_137190 [Trifolium subterraneum]
MPHPVRPNASPISPDSQTTSSDEHPKTPPPAGTYVIQVPKEQVYRYPPPENARRYANYTRKKTHPCRRCCCCICGLIIFLITLSVLLILAAVTCGLIFRPETPNYELDSIAVMGMNLTSSLISPEFDISIKAENGNEKIGIYYDTDSSVEIFYRDVSLCNGALPVFYQPSNNVTMFQTVLKGNGIELARSDRRALVKAVEKRRMPLSLAVIAPLEVKVGSVMKLKIRVELNCDLTVDELTAQAKIVHKVCHHGWDWNLSL